MIVIFGAKQSVWAGHTIPLEIVGPPHPPTVAHQEEAGRPNGLVHVGDFPREFFGQLSQGFFCGPRKETPGTAVHAN